MFLFKTVASLQAHLRQVREKGKTIGFVPTMGALHRGHASLIGHSIDEGHYTVVSIFVNPTQFNDAEDLEKYPKPIAEDLQFLFDLDCDVLFLPSENEVYPRGERVVPDLELAHLDSTLEAAFRPGHFEGVLQVVARLLEIVQPDYLFMGIKDLQQLVIIQMLIEKSGSPTQLKGLPIVREPNGLALSSRNERLTSENRKAASVIFKILTETRHNYKSKKLSELKTEAISQLDHLPFRPEYFEFVRGDNLAILNTKDDYNGTVYAVTAVWCDTIRLIDNMEMP